MNIDEWDGYSKSSIVLSTKNEAKCKPTASAIPIAASCGDLDQTHIKIAGVQPINNYAEQAIRETVLVRKIIGAFRSVGGTKTYETLASLIATWQLQKLNIKKELTRMLSANLC
ncbi:hypothetical protein HYX14_06390 [Candidatus Woesearchaeota archaeon]|nr:hypothetical protein [Candidatus Woesearchaeota archaeon]